MKWILLLFIPFVTYANEFEAEQWGLHNTGKAITVFQTDINTMDLPAKIGADIQLGNIQETKRIIKVAVIDSGIDLEHPDLKEQIYKKESECEVLEQYKKCLEESSDLEQCHKSYAHIDTDNNGYPLDCNGWNVAAPINEYTRVQGNPFVQDQIGHGTFVAGVIGAKDNDIGIKGVADSIKIIPVKVSGSDEEVEEENATDIFAKGIEYALNEKVDVINLSLGWPSNNDSLKVTKAIQKAHAMGVLVVVAAGNSAHSEISYPCSYNEVICVGSFDPDGNISHFSNRGASIDLFAPGRHILSTWPLNLRPRKFTIQHGYEYKDGTSFAAPFVAGAAAVLLNQGLTPLQVRTKLLSSKKQIFHFADALAGQLNVQASLRCAQQALIYPFKKTPALINWNKKNKSLIVKLKNYTSVIKDIQVELTSTEEGIHFKNSVQQVKKWEKGLVRDFTFAFESAINVNSDLKFMLRVTSTNHSWSYPIHAKGITVVHDKFTREDTFSSLIKSRKRLSLLDIKPVKNLEDEAIDFVAIEEKNKKVSIALLKSFDGHYKVSKFKKLDIKTATFSEIAKVDLNLDNSPEYVIVAHELVDEKWETYFFVFDSDFRESKLEIYPDNHFRNNHTTISSELYWTKQQDRVVPTWISIGFAAAEDLPRISPWEVAEYNRYEKRVYYLSPERLHVIDLGEDLTPVTFYPQSAQDVAQKRIKVLFTDSEGFVKDYYSKYLDEEIALTHHLPRYQNIFELKAQSNTFGKELFFTRMNLDRFESTISLLAKNETNVVQTRYQYVDPLDPIQLVFAKASQNSFFALTKYNLLYLNNGEIFKTESRNTHYFNQYHLIKNSKKLFLSGNHTPGYTSEVIALDEKKQQLVRSTRYRFVPYSGCMEIGLINQPLLKKDLVAFYCEKRNILHFIEL
jgi:hypothetical protein